MNISMYLNGIYVCMYLCILVLRIYELSTNETLSHCSPCIMYVCIYVMRVCMRVCMYVSMNVCDVLTCKLIPSFWRFCLSVPMFVRILMCVNKEVCMHVCMYVYIMWHVYMYIPKCVCIYV